MTNLEKEILRQLHEMSSVMHGVLERVGELECKLSSVQEELQILKYEVRSRN